MKNLPVSDGDNDYIIPAELSERFRQLRQNIEDAEERSDAWYDACEQLAAEFSEYQR